MLRHTAWGLERRWHCLEVFGGLLGLGHIHFFLRVSENNRFIASCHVPFVLCGLIMQGVQRMPVTPRPLSWQICTNLPTSTIDASPPQNLADVHLDHVIFKPLTDLRDPIPPYVLDSYCTD
jgi:hypothetical protein